MFLSVHSRRVPLFHAVENNNVRISLDNPEILYTKIFVLLVFVKVINLQTFS